MKPRRRFDTPRIARQWYFGIICTVAGLSVAAALSEKSRETWQAPSIVVADPEGDTLYTLCVRSRRLLALSDGAVRWSLMLEVAPTGLAMVSESPQLWVTCAGSNGFVELIDRQTRNRVARRPAGHGVGSPVIGPRTRRGYVCNRFDGEVQAFALDTGQELERIRVGREPIAAALTPDESLLVVANHLPTGRSDLRFVACEVTIIDTERLSVRTNLSLVNGGVLARGVAVSPDGRWAAVTHNLARFQVPTTQVEHGWMNDAALALIDLNTFQLRATLLLDEPDKGAANPAAVAWSEDSRWLVIAHAGSHELSVIEIQAVMNRILTTKPAHFVSDLGFLKDCRRRIPLRGNGARSLAVRGGSVWVAGYFSDTIEQVSLESGNLGRLIGLGGGAEGNCCPGSANVFSTMRPSDTAVGRVALPAIRTGGWTGSTGTCSMTASAIPRTPRASC